METSSSQCRPEYLAFSQIFLRFCQNTENVVRTDLFSLKLQLQMHQKVFVTMD